MHRSTTLLRKLSYVSLLVVLVAGAGVQLIAGQLPIGPVVLALAIVQHYLASQDLVQLPGDPVHPRCAAKIAR